MIHDHHTGPQYSEVSSWCHTLSGSGIHVRTRPPIIRYRKSFLAPEILWVLPGHPTSSLTLATETRLLHCFADYPLESAGTWPLQVAVSLCDRDSSYPAP